MNNRWIFFFVCPRLVEPFLCHMIDVEPPGPVFPNRVVEGYFLRGFFSRSPKSLIQYAVEERVLCVFIELDADFGPEFVR